MKLEEIKNIFDANGMVLEQVATYLNNTPCLITKEQMEQITAVEDDRLVCDNPRCISSTEQELLHKFKLVDKQNGIYRCIYCEGKKTLG